MLKRFLGYLLRNYERQPPSGGCVLKPSKPLMRVISSIQPPSGGCVLKLIPFAAYLRVLAQPPSGGCVLKLLRRRRALEQHLPAAFRRLCVETRRRDTRHQYRSQPPSGGCVLKLARRYYRP